MILLFLIGSMPINQRVLVLYDTTTPAGRTNGTTVRTTVLRYHYYTTYVRT